MWLTLLGAMCLPLAAADTGNAGSENAEQNAQNQHDQVSEKHRPRKKIHNLAIKNETSCPLEVSYGYANKSGTQSVQPEKRKTLVHSRVKNEKPTENGNMANLVIRADVTQQCPQEEGQDADQQNTGQKAHVEQTLQVDKNFVNRGEFLVTVYQAKDGTLQANLEEQVQPIDPVLPPEHDQPVQPMPPAPTPSQENGNGSVQPINPAPNPNA